MKINQDKLITCLVILLSCIAWGWNINVVFLGGDGKQASAYIHEVVIKWPIVLLILYPLGRWGAFSQWLRNHQLGLAYLCLVIAHLFWPLPR